MSTETLSFIENQPGGEGGAEGGGEVKGGNSAAFDVEMKHYATESQAVGSVACSEGVCSGGSCNGIEVKADGSLVIVTVRNGVKLGETPTTIEEILAFAKALQANAFMDIVPVKTASQPAAPTLASALAEQQQPELQLAA